MSAVLLAVFNDYQAAERVRIVFVQDGFPTDRVELTSGREPGRAALEPADSPRGKFVQYFRTLFCDAHEHPHAELLADRIEQGAATITVHPRGPIEVARASEILKDACPETLANHDLANQALEHASAKRASPWIRHFWLDSPTDSDCLYCRLFEHSAH